MIGNLFYNLVQVTYGSAGNENGWQAKVTFQDAGFCNDDTASGHISTEGHLVTRYMVKNADGVFGVRAAVETVIQDLASMNIAPMPGNVLLFVTNLEDEELDKSWTVSYSDIPKEELDEVAVLASEYGFEVAGIRSQV